MSNKRGRFYFVFVIPAKAGIRKIEPSPNLLSLISYRHVPIAIQEYGTGPVEVIPS